MNPQATGRRRIPPAIHFRRLVPCLLIGPSTVYNIPLRSRLAGTL
ncbi:MAG: hypothetical protein Kow0097_10560 [Candidatus Bipolaricaulota bacterium]